MRDREPVHVPLHPSPGPNLSRHVHLFEPTEQTRPAVDAAINCTQTERQKTGKKEREGGEWVKERGEEKRMGLGWPVAAVDGKIGFLRITTNLIVHTMFYSILFYYIFIYLFIKGIFVCSYGK